MLDDWRRGAIEIDPGVRTEVLRRFSRRKLAGELADVLRATIDGGLPREAKANANAGSNANGLAPGAPTPPVGASLASA